MRVKQFFEKMTWYMRTMDTNVGFNNPDVDETVEKTGKPLLVCVGAVTCMDVQKCRETLRWCEWIYFKFE